MSVITSILKKNFKRKLSACSFPGSSVFTIVRILSLFACRRLDDGHDEKKETSRLPVWQMINDSDYGVELKKTTSRCSKRIGYQSVVYILMMQHKKSSWCSTTDGSDSCFFFSKLLSSKTWLFISHFSLFIFRTAERSKAIVTSILCKN